MEFIRKIQIYCLIISLAVLLAAHSPIRAEENQEDTYSISLVQTAEADKEIVEVDDRKVLTESYTIQKGDHLWKLLRERGLLKKRTLPQILSMLKRLNDSLGSLDLIHPGQKIVIPLTITPLKGVSGFAQKAPETPLPLEELKDIALENYTVQPGDSLIKVVTERYRIPPRDLHNEYLQLIKRLNPSIKDINTIYPKQTIRLPIYSPQIVRMPVKPKPPVTEPEPVPKAEPKAPKPSRSATAMALGRQLGEIFSELGEEWVSTGEHFIPLKAGGQVNLEADSFPIINLSDGNRIIVDLYNDLPEKMAQMITANWETYRIVHLSKDGDLRGAMDKILSICGYQKIYGPGEPLEFGGDIPVKITADWIIQGPPGPSGPDGRTAVVTLMEAGTPGTPGGIARFLRGLGVRVIDYPLTDSATPESGDSPDIIEGGGDLRGLTETILKLTDHSFSSRVEIPIYQSQKTHFNLIVKADFLLNLGGRDSVIDITGLSPEILSLLREHRFSTLSLNNEKEPLGVLSKILDFLGVPFNPGPHNLMATSRPESKNIRLTVPGIIFQGKDGLNIFATPLKLPDEIAIFLSQKGYRILGLNLS